MPRPYRSPVVLVVLVSTLAAATSRAASPDALERARRLFLQAEANEDDNRWSEALDKFRAVSLVKLTSGVRYHIALCEEHLGRLALALKDYRAAEEQAKVDHAKDVLRTVGRDLATLEARVPRLTIRVSPPLADTSVKLDGEPIADALIDSAIPVDPGVHYVEVRAPDRPASTQAVALSERESRTLEVTLGPPVRPGSRAQPDEAMAEPSTSNGTAPATPGGPPPPPSVLAVAPAPPHAHRASAVVATALSVGLAGVGLVAFFVSGNAHDHAVQACSSIVTRAPDACDSLKTVVRAWDWVAAGAWTAALAAGSVAIVLWTKQPEANSPSPRATTANLGVTLGPATLAAWGNF